MAKQKVWFHFKLLKHLGFPPPSVQAAIDLDGDEKADEDEWMRLTRDDLSWAGSREIERENLDGLLVMASYVATVGTRWEAEVRRGGADGPALASARGVVKRVPEALWLWCEEK